MSGSTSRLTPDIGTRRLLKAVAFADVLADAESDADAVDQLDETAWHHAILVLRGQGFRTRIADILRQRQPAGAVA